MCSIANIKLRLNNDGVETILEIPSNIFEKISTLNDMVQDSFTENSTEDSSNIVDLPPNVINLDIMNLIIEYYQKYFECQNYDDYMIMRWEKDIFDKINYEKFYQTADYLNCKEILYKFNVCALLIQHKKNNGLIHDKDFDAGKLRMTIPSDIKFFGNRRSAKMNYADMQYYGEKFVIESPWLKTMKGVHYINPYKTSCSMDVVEPPLYDINANHQIIENWFKQFAVLDQYILQKVVEMQNQLYGTSNQTVAEIQTKFLPFVKRYRDNNHYFFKISNHDIKQLCTTIYDIETHKKIEYKNLDELITLIPSNSSVKVIIRPTIWFMNGNFGITWMIKELLLETRKEYSLSEDSFLNAGLCFK
jgi:hypothetical protein